MAEFRGSSQLVSREGKEICCLSLASLFTELTRGGSRILGVAFSWGVRFVSGVHLDDFSQPDLLVELIVGTGVNKKLD